MKHEKFSSIVERELLLHDENSGKKSQLTVAIGTPYWTEINFEAACPIALYGYHGRLADIRGIDPLSALSLAIQFQESLLLGLPKNLTVLWPNGERYFEE
ncbi:hypothetical protein [Hydrogenophaga luteola]|uniref:Uncharacterized protein n=1 Tax=Hydrogenophaga luteola TaxID=1591122 RepID=A0ABV7W2U4_9BURK